MAADEMGSALLMRRRGFLLASGVLLASPFATAQQPAAATRVLGILSSGRAPTPQELATNPLQAALRKLGWVEGQNLRVERAFAEGREERLSSLADELVQKRVDIILTNGPTAALAAARATRTIPIVFYLAGAPVVSGLVDSLARPGRNATGIAFSEAGVTVKEFELIKELAPRARRLASLTVPSMAFTVTGAAIPLDFMDDAAKKLGFVLQRFPVERAKDFDEAFNKIIAWRAQAPRVIPVPLTIRERSRIIDFAARNRLPCVSSSTPWVEAGALASYGATFDGLLQRSLVMVDKIFRGAKPADIPVEQPTRYELAINLKTARTLKLKIPPSILARADRVIE